MYTWGHILLKCGCNFLPETWLWILMSENELRGVFLGVSTEENNVDNEWISPLC